MINYIVGFLFIILLALLVAHGPGIVVQVDSPTYSLGLLMLVSFFMGEFARKAKLPAITGYLLAGMLIGPKILSLVPISHLNQLSLLNGLALSLIALSAGGEIKISLLKRFLKPLLAMLSLQTLSLLIGLPLLLILGAQIFAYPLPFKQVLAASILIAVISTASSPSTTLAVIVESRKKNALTGFILSVVMMKDVIILFIFVVALSFGKSVASELQGQDGANLLRVVRELSGSLLAGICIGIVIVLFLKYVRRHQIVFLLAICFFAYELFEPLHLHPLLIMMGAGFLVSNFSNQGEKLIEQVEYLSPPVYIVFFGLAGVGFRLDLLLAQLPLALFIVGARMVLKALGSRLAVSLYPPGNGITATVWTGFVAQAGLSFGMALIIEQTIPGYGPPLAALIISVVIVNQLLGPPLLKLLLQRSTASDKGG